MKTRTGRGKELKTRTGRSNLLVHVIMRKGKMADQGTSWCGKTSGGKLVLLGKNWVVKTEIPGEVQQMKEPIFSENLSEGEWHLES